MAQTPAKERAENNSGKGCRTRRMRWGMAAPHRRASKTRVMTMRSPCKLGKTMYNLKPTRNI